jgi:hypothetical protein
MKNISPAKPGISEDCAGQSEQLRQDKGKSRGKTPAPEPRVETVKSEAAPDDLAELIANRLLFAFRHCATMPTEGPAYVSSSFAAILDDMRELRGAIADSKRIKRLYRRFVKLACHDASWFEEAVNARNARRQLHPYRNPVALMFDAFAWMYEVPLLDKGLREWLRTAEFDQAAAPETWDTFMSYCWTVAEHLRAQGREPIEEVPVPFAPLASDKMLRGVRPIADNLRRSVKTTLRMIEGGKLPVVDLPEGLFAMRDALAPHRRYDKAA